MHCRASVFHIKWKSRLQSQAALCLRSSTHDTSPSILNIVDKFYVLLAEAHYEPFSDLDNSPDFEFDNFDLQDDLTPTLSPIDLISDGGPKFWNYWILEARLETFFVDSWLQHPTSRFLALKPESLARAGFFYFGADDNVKCFWCGLCLHQWRPTDEPISEHMRVSPSCGWLYRLLQRSTWLLASHHIR